MSDDGDNDDGPVAAVWTRYGRLAWFRVGVLALVAGAVGTGVARVAGVATWVLPASQACVLVGTIVLWIVVARHGRIATRTPPAIEGGPRPVKVQFRGAGGGYFARGAGEIHFPEGALRFVAWEVEWWDLLVVAAFLIGAHWALGGGVWIWGMPLSAGLPRRRLIMADVEAGDIESMIAGDLRLTVTTRSGEPRRELVVTADRFVFRRVLAALRGRFGERLIDRTPPPPAATTPRSMDETAASLRALREASDRSLRS